jgi:succinate-semialdehyde dehydrogenase/glutarate-semialdehyde dehydrogenase
VHKNVYDEFINIVQKSIKALNVGNPLLEETDVGPLAKNNFITEIDALVQSSIKKGAKCLLGGKYSDLFYEPTLLIDVKEGMDVFTCETFGPIFCVSKIADS